jgi:hypothetical protein
MLRADLHSGHVHFDAFIDDGAVETPHLRDRRQLVHPDTGQVRFAVGSPRRGRCKIGFAVRRPRCARNREVHPLRLGTRGDGDSQDGQA